MAQTMMNDSVKQTMLPWQPLFSIVRSGMPEMTHYGTACVMDGRGEILLSHGNIDAPIWTRSVLKPFQLWSLLPYLQSQFPQLTEEHWTMMMASHQGDAIQLELLSEICDLGNILPEQLHCPTCYPMSMKNGDALKSSLQKPDVLYHPCSGKHMGYVLHQKATGHLQDYCQQDYPAFHHLHNQLTERLGPICGSWTLDGCGLPNLALSTEQITRLYAQLATSTVADGFLYTVADWMRRYPLLIGGEGRLDTCLMLGKQTPFTYPDVSVIAKEGADGLLALGVNKCELYPEGLGIVLKLSTGYSVKHMSLLAIEILRQLGLTERRPNHLAQSVLEYQFHFDFSQ